MKYQALNWILKVKLGGKRQFQKYLLLCNVYISGRPVGPLGFYVQGSLDGKRPGTLYINTKNLKTQFKFDLMRYLTFLMGYQQTPESLLVIK